MAAPSVRAAGAATSGITMTSVTITKPAGTAAGDVLYAVVANGGANTAPSTVPSGWALVDSAGGTTWWGGLYRLVAGGAEPSNYTWSGFTDSCTGCMVAVQGADTTTPENAHTVRANLDPATGTGGLTTTVADCLILSAGALDDNRSMGPWACATDPTVLTEAIEQLSSGGADTGSGIATAAKATAGATGASSYTLLGGANNTGVLVAIQPPGGGGGPITGPAATASETETAHSIGRTKTRAQGPAAETDTAQTFGRVKTRAAAPAAETETARPLGAQKTRTTGGAADVETAQPLARRKTRATPATAEAETAEPFGRVKVRALGTAVETETAQQLPAAGGTLAGAAAEGEAAQPLGRAKVRASGASSEMETATPFGRVKIRALGTAVEMSIAPGLDRRKARAVVTAVEAETAQAFGDGQVPLIGHASAGVRGEPHASAGAGAAPYARAGAVAIPTATGGA